MDEELDQFIKSYIMATSGKRGNDVFNDQSQKNLPVADETATGNHEKEQAGNAEDGEAFADLINTTEFHSLSSLDEFGTPVAAGFQNFEWKLMELDDLAEFDSIQDVTKQFSTQNFEPVGVNLPDQLPPAHFGISNLETNSDDGNGLKDAWSDEGLPGECGETSKPNKRKIEAAAKKVKKPRILSAYAPGEKPMTELDYDEAMLIWESLKSQGLDKFKRRKNEGIVEAREEAEDQKMDDHEEIFAEDFFMQEKVKSFPVAVPKQTELQSP